MLNHDHRIAQGWNPYRDAAAVNAQACSVCSGGGLLILRAGALYCATHVPQFGGAA